ncbi:MAG TPA: cell division protein FtsZ [Bacteroidia bacterium]|nr:cell division protein FtsZ [Sphingobacteriales bacterium]HPD65275.1 cell division protein FtsZ [Bacteroidia bacterium]HRS58654.1 cell division protein FtsZ [Bacteroidia bacterium]HRU67861.1 cell division protein FtsZ [Bacteroidia bacterium]
MVKLNFDFQKDETSIIKVIGVGGGGSNAVSYMFKEGITGVEFLVCNTDNQALEKSPVAGKIQIGSKLTAGRGVGGDPEIGKRAALDDIEKIKAAIGGDTKMLFITAGMGGGTGTGAAPVIAQLSQEMGLLTVGIVTFPFQFEGPKRIKAAEEGIEELRKYVDALLIIRNEKLLEMFNGLPLTKAFSHADNVLATAAKGIAEIITVPGEMNVDFEDVKAIMKNSGTAIMGNGKAEGEDRATKAVKAALNSPLLKEKDIRGAQHILLNLSYGEEEIQVEEVTKITDYIRQEVGNEVDMKLGYCNYPALGKALSVTLIATSLEGRTKDSPKEEPVISEKPKLQETEKSEPPIDEDEDEIIILEDEEQEKKFEQLKLNFDKTPDPYIKKPKQADTQSLPDLKNPAYFEKIETIPAYLRKKVTLTDVPSADEIEISRFVLDDDAEKGPELKEENSFLSDNVD